MYTYKDEADRYFVSILVEEDITSLEMGNKMIGFDVGLESMVMISNGHTYGNPKFFHNEYPRDDSRNSLRP